MVVFVVCLVCSLLVSTAAVMLSPRQLQNKQLDKIKNILVAGDLYRDGVNVLDIYESKIQPKMVELSSGSILSEDQFDETLNIKNFDITLLANSAEYGLQISPENDIAGIKNRPEYMLVYFVIEKDQVEKIILPVYGKGLWSTMYAFVAIDKDLKTIDGVTFYEHGETPGLGGEIENPRWNEIWQGKLAFDDNWNVKLHIIKGAVDPAREESKYQIDGLSGATITTRGVDNMMKYWLGENGYGTFLNKIREEIL
jgi:Na+-transporting NADH:ubiquinone oxidoreductase subunit C